MREDWVTKKIIELGEIQTGTTPSTKTKEYYGDFIPFVKPPHFNEDGTINYDNSGLSSKGLEKGRLIKENSILMVCIGATIGKTGLTSIPVSCNQQINSFTPNANLEPKFFYYLLSSSVFFKKVMHLSSQATLPMINKSKWQSIEVSFPKSLQEQKQIVAILEKAFAAIDQAKANIEKNIENAKELFQSKLNDIFSQKGDGWEEMSIDKISTVVNGYSFKSKDFSGDNEIKSIKITNVGIMDFVEDSSNNLPASFLTEYSRVKVHKGNLVLALTRTIISGGLKVARVPESYHNSLLNQRVAAIVPNLELVDSDYLYYYFSSNIVYNYVLDNVNTLMQPNLSIGDLKKMPVPITSIEGQKIISNQIEDLAKKTNSLVSNYENKLKDIEDLKKSILQKAFAGELTLEEVVL